ncbi:hypothetical protein D4764_09G0007590 [Takifugu flavidus]|uniref:Uncharacterized protein n=1 Tax=Takifugu flavidus TaxID=433684 RepID=A0A5C6MLT3_9TELE|nr:hypothetical protein D4764_09G0007590 [Takifugu flavidus]
MPVEPNWNHQHESEQKPAGSSVSIMRSSSMRIFADFNQPESSRPTAGGSPYMSLVLLMPWDSGKRLETILIVIDAI